MSKKTQIAKLIRAMKGDELMTMANDFVEMQSNAADEPVVDTAQVHAIRPIVPLPQLGQPLRVPPVRRRAAVERVIVRRQHLQRADVRQTQSDSR